MAKQVTQSGEGDARLQQRGARRMLESKSRLEVRNQAEDGLSAELVLEGPIWSSAMAFEGEISPANVRKALEEIGEVGRLDVYLSSLGGDPWAAQAIHAALKRFEAEVVVHLDGMVASGATIIALAADRVIAHPYSTFMIHAASLLLIGWFNSQELRETADVSDKIDQSVVATYQAKTGLDADELKAMMDSETWLVGKEIIDAGFADEIDEEVEAAASIEGDTLTIGNRQFDLSPYRNRPSIGQHLDVDPDPGSVHISGLKEVTANQFRDALASALGFTIKDQRESSAGDPPAEPPPTPGASVAPQRGRSFYAHRVAMRRNEQRQRELMSK